MNEKILFLYREMKNQIIRNKDEETCSLIDGCRQKILLLSFMFFFNFKIVYCFFFLKNPTDSSL